MDFFLLQSPFKLGTQGINILNKYSLGLIQWVAMITETPSWKNALLKDSCSFSELYLSFWKHYSAIVQISQNHTLKILLPEFSDFMVAILSVGFYRLFQPYYYTCQVLNCIVINKNTFFPQQLAILYFHITFHCSENYHDSQIPVDQTCHAI